MFQVTFTEQAINELNKMDKTVQLGVIESLGAIKPSDLAHPREPLGKFSRENKEYYRLRIEEYRFYFLVHEDLVQVTYILHSNSLEDFLLRNKLPVSEQQLAEQHSKFWKYLESLRK